MPVFHGWEYAHDPISLVFLRAGAESAFQRNLGILQRLLQFGMLLRLVVRRLCPARRNGEHQHSNERRHSADLLHWPASCVVGRLLGLLLEDGVETLEQRTAAGEQLVIVGSGLYE